MLKDFCLPCWCGARDRTDFAPGYDECCACHTLLSKLRGERQYEKIENEEEDFYGKGYWFGHQTEDLGLPDLQGRVTTDFVDRYPHWLQLVYELGLTSGKTLELGCGHGGFVYLLQQSGFDATGLELSPWLADYARRQYQIPMLTGRLGDQGIAPQTYDLVLAFDVLEHLEEPLGTLQTCRQVLKPGGQLLLQTPVRPDGLSYQELLERDHPFLKMLLPDEHLFLFPASSLHALLKRAGFTAVADRCSVFPQHDITVSASTEAIGARSLDAVEPPPVASALIRLFAANQDLKARLVRLERDANERLELLNQQEAAMVRLERDANERLELLNQQEAAMVRLERDASERLELLNQQEAAMVRLERDASERLELLNQQGAAMVRLERDANERLRLLQEADVALQAQSARCTALEESLARARGRKGIAEPKRSGDAETRR